MKLLELNIRNYKSLGDVTFKPTPLSVIIGPNASGKSNFANALSFLSEVYDYDLETAIRRKGGYENIALRKIRRSKSAVEFSIIIEIDENDSNEIFIPLTNSKETIKNRKGTSTTFCVKHSFSIKAQKQTIRADFAIEKEEFGIYKEYYNQNECKPVFSFVRVGDKITHSHYDEESNKIPRLDFFKHFFTEERLFGNVTKDLQRLVISNGIFALFGSLKDNIGNWAIYQFTPNQTRMPGVPTPNPEMSNHGENLPALVDWLKINEKKRWSSILSTMQTVIPNLLDITTDYLHNKTLGVFFHEKGSGRPWNSDEVSDGTMLTLSILCSINDLRKTLIVIEEPENSLHAWILRNLVEEFRKVSSEKNVILTTHSTILLDLLNPKEIWCISKQDFETRLDKILDIEPKLLHDWEEGLYKISDYLDSGLMPQAVPGGLI